MSAMNIFSMRPKMPFRFKTIWYLGEKYSRYEENIGYAVRSINIPKIGIETEFNMSLGNTNIIVPTYKPSNRKLEVEFEENDELDVIYILENLMEEGYGRRPYQILVIVEEFNEGFTKSKRIGYYVHLSGYDEMTFNRDGAVNAVSIRGTFIVDEVIDETDDIIRNRLGYNDEVSKVFNENIYKEYNLDLDETEKYEYTTTREKLMEVSSRNDKRQENYKRIRDAILSEKIDIYDEYKVTQWLMRNGYIAEKYDRTGLCALSTTLISALTSGSEEMWKSENGQNIGKTLKNYTEIVHGTGNESLEKIIKYRKLQSGDVISITYADGSEYGHAVKVIENPKTHKLEYYSDFKQASASGQSDKKRVGKFIILRDEKMQENKFNAKKEDAKKEQGEALKRQFEESAKKIRG